MASAWGKSENGLKDGQLLWPFCRFLQTEGFLPVVKGGLLGSILAKIQAEVTGKVRRLQSKVSIQYRDPSGHVWFCA